MKTFENVNDFVNYLSSLADGEAIAPVVSLGYWSFKKNPGAGRRAHVHAWTVERLAVNDSATVADLVGDALADARARGHVLQVTMSAGKKRIRDGRGELFRLYERGAAFKNRKQSQLAIERDGRTVGTIK